MNIINYVWLGGKQKPDLVRACIDSWRKYCPSATIKEWNEENYDINSHPYVRQAYRDGKYAFAADYIRMDVLYRYGGVYLDTDVELIRDITPLLSDNFMGLEGAGRVAPGLIINSHKFEPLLKKILTCYDDISSGSINYDRTIVDIVSDILIKDGLRIENTLQCVDNFFIYPTEYFNPMGETYGRIKITENTYSIHHYMASWKNELDQKIMRYKVKYGKRKGKLLFIIRHPILALQKRKDRKC